MLPVIYFLFLEYDEKHAGLKQNKETLDNHFRSLKKGMNKSRDQDREKLTKAGFQIDTHCHDFSALLIGRHPLSIRTHLKIFLS